MSFKLLEEQICSPLFLSSHCKNALSLDASTQSYMISASLIASGLLSMIQMSRIKLPYGYYLGTGQSSVDPSRVRLRLLVPRFLR